MSSEPVQKIKKVIVVREDGKTVVYQGAGRMQIVQTAKESDRSSGQSINYLELSLLIQE